MQEKFQIIFAKHDVGKFPNLEIMFVGKDARQEILDIHLIRS